MTLSERKSGHEHLRVEGARSSCDVLFLFAHQDDEVGISTRISYETRLGNRVWCAYMTDGARSVAAAVRDAESLRVLRGLGVDSERVAFLSDGEGRICDGLLPQSLVRARIGLGRWIVGTGAHFERIFTMDWEGGHHDHDAAFLLALAAARDAAIPTVYAYSMYNAYRRPAGFFRVASFVPADASIVRRKLAFVEALSAAILVVAYPSQRRTWIGLGPGFVARMLFRREERFRSADVRRCAGAPHEGAMLYESMFGVRARDVLLETAEFRAALLAGGASAATTPSGHV